MDNVAHKPVAWFRFNLRTLFAVVTAVAIGLFVAGVATDFESRPDQTAVFALIYLPVNKLAAITETEDFLEAYGEWWADCAN